MENNGKKRIKYNVKIVEKTYGFVEVEATSPEEAVEKAEEIYFDGNAFWNDTDAEYFIDE